ncbi:MAG: PqqD family protein [Planctomycetaceae bacterium]|jgi:hypothetical protein|nr:PqqD family protein [Planctomycetaceae bacterium]
MYSFLQPFYPKFTCCKIRHEDGGEVAVVANSELDISFFNSTACRFIELADGRRTLADIFDVMQNEYDVDAPVLQTDLIELVRDMQRKRLLTLHKQPFINKE